MNVFYEESGAFKVGTIIASNQSHIQIDTQYGKRTKVKVAHVILDFNTPLDSFLPDAERLCGDIDLEFLWECSPEDEFNYQHLAQDYWGHTPSAQEAAAILMRLFHAPMYFYKKGRGHYKKAPAATLRAALAGMERKQREQDQIQAWVTQLKANTLPEALHSQLMTLLWKPNKHALEYKALDQAAQELNISPLRLAYQAGGIPSIPDYLLAGFKIEHFPKGFDFEPYTPLPLPNDLPVASVQAFSIDNANTTEIDDAFSVTRLPNGNQQIGIHIACPTLAYTEKIEQLVLDRLSTVYFPGHKITMLPSEMIALFSLQANRNCPALSLYVEVDPELNPIRYENRIEQVPVVSNLRLGTLEPLFNTETLNNDNGNYYPFKEELTWLWQFAIVLEKRRGKYDPNRIDPPDYHFELLDGKISITQRKRGAPIDKLVSELMIMTNSEWGRMLAEANIPGIYRAQTTGKVRMTTRPEAHQGLGVEQYLWSTSPLRRASDFINQRQLCAMVQGRPAPFAANDAMLFSILRNFDAAYSAYGQFQDKMEHFWCLRWLQQENITEVTAHYLKDDLIRFNHLPLKTRIAGLPKLSGGETLKLSIVRIDELTQDIELRFIGKISDELQNNTCLVF